MFKSPADPVETIYTRLLLLVAGAILIAVLAAVTGGFDPEPRPVEKMVTLEGRR